MSNRIRAHLRSNVYGLVAVFIALGGTAYATHPGGENTIDSGDIVNGQVKSPEISNSNGVRSPDVVNGSLTGSDIEDNTINADDVFGLRGDDDIADGSLGGADVATGSLTGQDVADNSLNSDDVFGLRSGDVEDGALTPADLRAPRSRELQAAPIPSNETNGNWVGREATVWCAPGEIALGGGARLTAVDAGPGDEVAISESHSIYDPDTKLWGWKVWLSSDYTSWVPWKAHVLCL